MDISSGDWLSDLAKEDPRSIMNHCDMMMMNSNTNDDYLFDNIYEVQHKIMETEHDLGSSVWETNNNNNNNNNNNSISWSSSGQLICFGSSEFERKPKIKKNGGKKVENITASKEHVVAERKRREKMTRGFLSLSALIPHLHKMDKASILSDATKYIKELEEQAKKLEEQSTIRIVECAYLVNNIMSNQQVLKHNNNNNNNNNNYNNNNNNVLEIEAKMLNHNILIRIHSLKKEGLIQKILEEIVNLRLTTINCQTIPFGTYAIDVTITAQVSDDFDMTIKDLMKHLREVLQNYIF